MSTLESVQKSILNDLDHSQHISFEAEQKLSFGDFVLSGMNTNGKQAFGYVTQIRMKCGAFGSDIYFVREANGNLGTHENQSFWKLTKDQANSLAPFFTHLPAEELAENPNLTYTVCGEYEESGFIVTETETKSGFEGEHITMAFTITKSGAKA